MTIVEVINPEQNSSVLNLNYILCGFLLAILKKEKNY